MVLAYYGIEQDEVTLTMMCNTDLSGTALEDMVSVAQHFRLSAKRSRLTGYDELEQNLEDGIAVIAHVDATNLYEQSDAAPLGHLVVVLSVNEIIIVHDPAKGAEQRIPRVLFENAWNTFRKGVVKVWKT